MKALQVQVSQHFGPEYGMDEAERFFIAAEMRKLDKIFGQQAK
jgi:hypothetical protein